MIGWFMLNHRHESDNAFESCPEARRLGEGVLPMFRPFSRARDGKPETGI